MEPSSVGQRSLVPALTAKMLYRDKTNNKQGAAFPGPGCLLVINGSRLVPIQSIGSVPCMVPMTCLKDVTCRRQPDIPTDESFLQFV